MICKYLTGQGDDWTEFIPSCLYAMNTFITPDMGYSPYELVYGYQPPDICGYDFDPSKCTTIEAKEYIQNKAHHIEMMKQIVFENRKIQEKLILKHEQRKNPNEHTFCTDDLVYLKYEQGSDLKTTSRKLKKEWIGPFRIAGILDQTHYWISDVEGKIIPTVIHSNKIKLFNVQTGQNNIGITTTSKAREFLESLTKAYVDGIT
jgi:hypothetical protein